MGEDAVSPFGKAGLGFAYLINSWGESATESIAEAVWFLTVLAHHGAAFDCKVCLSL